MISDQVADRLRNGYTVDPDSGCWRWTGRTDHWGYGVLKVARIPRLVHRLAHELWIGPIPEGLEIDHVKARGCLHVDCYNPAHLEAVTHAENMRRGKWATRTHCPKGHPYDEANTYLSPLNKRYCRACWKKA